MKSIVRSTVFALCASICVSGTAIAAESPIEKAVKARKAVMQLYSFNLGQLGAMAKGTVEYNADVASAAANNLLALASMNQAAIWPQGSDNGSLGEITRAKPEIWSTYPAIVEKSKALMTGVTNMAAMAGKDLASLKGAMGGLGGACGGCHKAFRIKK
ncbi:MAG: cytochrome c [Rhizobiaceae bacterium]|nr:cytochrome c [Rhizobiaceae bacterium]